MLIQKRGEGVEVGAHCADAEKRRGEGAHCADTEERRGEGVAVGVHCADAEERRGGSSRSTSFMIAVVLQD